MEKLIAIISSKGKTSGKKSFTIKRQESNKMIRRKSSASRKRRVKRKNPYKHRPVVYSKRRKAKRGDFYRSAKARLPFRANKRRKIRRRRNPFSMRSFKVKQYFGKDRLIRGLSLIGGIGAGAFGKGIIANMMPSMLTTRFGSLGLLIIGAMVNQKGRRATIKNLGTGIVAFSIYDLLVQNVPMLAAYLPTIGAPTLNRSSVSGSLSYGRQTYGSQMPRGGNVEVVGAAIGPGMSEIVGDDMDLAEALEMAA